jgi:hypothetical protein
VHFAAAPVLLMSKLIKCVNERQKTASRVSKGSIKKNRFLFPFPGGKVLDVGWRKYLNSNRGTMFFNGYRLSELPGRHTAVENAHVCPTCVVVRMMLVTRVHTRNIRLTIGVIMQSVGPNSEVPRVPRTMSR